MISIGALSRSSGIPTETIRTWERRYGFPVPIRRSSGHRRYELETVERLRLIKQALDQGHKPSTVVPSELVALRRMLVITEPEPVEQDKALAPWMNHIKALNGDALMRLMLHEWNSLGATAFIQTRVGPLLTRIGEQWAQGNIGVMHEHFASERLRDFLASRWRPMSDASHGPTLVCATLPHEAHVIGLHLAAVTLAMADVRLIFLGADTPIDEIARAANDQSAKGVVISISIAADPQHTHTHLGDLRAHIAPEIPILVGGTGAPEDIPGVSRVTHFQDLQSWASSIDKPA